MRLGPARHSRYTNPGLVNEAQLIIIHKKAALEQTCPKSALSRFIYVFNQVHIERVYIIVCSSVHDIKVVQSLKSWTTQYLSCSR